MDHTCFASKEEVRVLCESISETGTKNIALLKAIDQTIDWLTRIQNMARVDADYAEKTAAAIATCARENPIDQESQLCNAFAEAETVLEEFHAALTKKRDAGRRAPELVGDHKDAIENEYARALDAVAALHTAMGDLRWAIMEHDADLAPVVAAFSTAEDMADYFSRLK